MESKKSVLGVQYLRGLAALGVVFCHFGSGLKAYPDLSNIFNYGQNGVHVFFLISGFIIVYSLTAVDYKPRQFFKFLLKRSIRIDPSYLVTIILTLLLFKALSLTPSFNGTAIPFIPQQFIAHIFYIIPFTKYEFYNHVFWTLCIEFQFYVLIGLLYFIARNQVYKVCFLVLFGLTCLIQLPNAYYIVFTYAPVFCLGISIVNLFRSKSIINMILPAFFEIIISYKFGIGIAALLLVSCFIILFVKKFSKIFFLLGEISYSLYLIHSLIFIVIIGILKRLNADLSKHELLWLLLEVTITTIASYVFYIAVERPSLKLSKKIFYGH